MKRTRGHRIIRTVRFFGSTATFFFLSTVVTTAVLVVGSLQGFLETTLILIIGVLQPIAILCAVFNAYMIFLLILWMIFRRRVYLFRFFGAVVATAFGIFVAIAVNVIDVLAHPFF